MVESRLEDVLHIVQDIHTLRDRIRDFFAAAGGSPASGSKADKEIAEFPKPSPVKTAYTQGNLLLNSVSDHVTAFAKTMTNSVEAIAAWTLVRGAVEASAMSAWLLDPSIGVKERVSRSYAYRYDGIEEERKLCEAINKPDEAKRSSDRIDHIEREAISFGYQRVLDKNRKRIGVAQRMPSNTEIIQQAFSDPSRYRILSAMAHSLPFAITQLAYKAATPNSKLLAERSTYHDELVAFEPHLSIESFGLLCHWAVSAVVKPAWSQCELFGWNDVVFTAILDEITVNHIKPERRFWRS